MEINEELLKDIASKVKNKDITWAEGAEEWKQQTGEEITANAIKKRYYRLEKKGKKPPNVSAKIDVDGSITTTHKNGVIEGLIYVNTIEELLDHLERTEEGFNRNFYEVVLFSKETRSSKWDSPVKDGGKQTLKAKKDKVSYRLKPLKEPKFNEKEFLENFKELLKKAPKDYKFNIDKPKKIEGLDKDKLLECGPIELHLGSLSWYGDTAFNYDNKIAADNFRKIIYNLIELQEREQAHKLVLCVGGDFFNSDTPDNTTTKGTVMHNDVRWKKMFELGGDLYKWAIEELEPLFNEIEIRNVPGNHDRTTSYYLYSVLQARYEDREKIKFGEHTRELQELAFGKNLIIWHHGDVNFKRLIKSISSEFREEWGKANIVELHLGHLHSEMVLEDNGLIARRNSTPKSTDYYEYNQRFYGAIKKHQLYVWDKNDGLVMIYNVNFNEKQKKLK